MILLLKIIAAHILGDFVLQPTAWVLGKEKNRLKSPQFYAHLAVHAALLALFLWDWKYWGFIAVLILIHGAIDIIKSYFQKESNQIQWFLIDQGLHLVSIFILWWLWFDPGFFPYFTEVITLFPVWLYGVAFMTLTSVSGIVIKVLLSKWTTEIEGSDGKETTVTTGHQKLSLTNAGKFIGYIERFLVFLFVMTNNWQAIGFLLATKSIFRFGDLKEAKDRKLTEYILVGTLLSFGIAIFIAMIVVFLQKNLIF